MRNTPQPFGNYFYSVGVEGREGLAREVVSYTSYPDRRTSPRVFSLVFRIIALMRGLGTADIAGIHVMLGQTHSKP
jgi:hypothetical protein